MYKEFRRELMTYVLEREITNIYVYDGQKLQKITIGKGGIDKKSVQFNSAGFELNKGPISSVWYSYANIQRIEVFGYEHKRNNISNG